MRRLETIAVSIARPLAEVYDYLSTPQNLFKWAAVLGEKAHPVAPLEWVAEEPTFTDRPVVIRFTPRNRLGVLDFWATIDGVEVYAAHVRVVANGEGSELTFGAFFEPGGDEAAFRSELEWVRADLLSVKSMLES